MSRGYACHTKETKADATIVKACETTAQNARARYKSIKMRKQRQSDQVRQKMQQREDRQQAVEPARPRQMAQACQQAKIKSAAGEEWKQRWKAYQQQVQQNRAGTRRVVATAVQTEWNPQQYRVHDRLNKAQSTIATLLRTEHIGLADYLSRRKVPDYPSPACECGFERQTAKHIVLYCPRFERDRDKMIEEAGTSDFRCLLANERGLRAVTTWFLQRGILSQFSLAKEVWQRQGRRGRRAGCDVDD